MTTAEKFEEAKKQVLTLPSKPGNEVLLELYALNKQATEGEVNVEPPKMFDFVGAAKYNAWKAKAGMSQEEAMTKYTELVDKLLKG